MAKKPSGLGRGLDELLEDNTPSRHSSARNKKPLVEAKDEFVTSTGKSTVAGTAASTAQKNAAQTSSPANISANPSANAQNNAKNAQNIGSMPYQSKVKPLYNTQRPTLKSNFKNNLNNKDTR